MLPEWGQIKANLHNIETESTPKPRTFFLQSNPHSAWSKLPNSLKKLKTLQLPTDDTIAIYFDNLEKWNHGN
jgi:hypothetical protein